MTEQATAPRRQAVNVAPFTIEFGSATKNVEPVVNVWQQQFRGSWSLAPHRGRTISRMRQAFANMPDIPGVRLRIDVRSKTVTIYDPLEKDASLLDRISTIMKQCGWVARDQNLKPVEQSVRNCNDDELKTLIWELGEKMKCDLCRMVQGEFPTDEQIDALPGRLLFDPWNNSPRKPRYQDQVEQWQRDLDARG